ncbi:EAL domain-containing protein [Halomonas llamarensis]|uniref:EAL domain-containing protein n=1 Tax=Halomonas llamarensis TaxID=2945104 RepID=UPI003D343477
MPTIASHGLQCQPSPALPEQVSTLVRPYMDPAWVTLEITESVLMTDPIEMETLLKRLHEQNFQIAIDDFGTGFSSLSRFQYLPP